MDKASMAEMAKKFGEAMKQNQSQLTVAVKKGDKEALKRFSKAELVDKILEMEKQISQYRSRDYNLSSAAIVKHYELNKLQEAYEQLQDEAERLTLRNRELERQLHMRYPGGRAPRYSDELKEEVRRFYSAGGQTYKSTAAHFGMSKSTVNRILNQK